MEKELILDLHSLHLAGNNQVFALMIMLLLNCWMLHLKVMLMCVQVVFLSGQKCGRERFTVIVGWLIYTCWGITVKMFSSALNVYFNSTLAFTLTATYTWKSVYENLQCTVYTKVFILILTEFQSHKMQIKNTNYFVSIAPVTRQQIYSEVHVLEAGKMGMPRMQSCKPVPMPLQTLVQCQKHPHKGYMSMGGTQYWKKGRAAPGQGKKTHLLMTS